MHMFSSRHTVPSCFLLHLFIFISMFSLCLTPSLADPRISQSGIYCSKSRPPPNTTTIIPSFVKEMEGLSQKVIAQHWGTSFVNSTVPMYGLAQCYEDLSHIDCLLCFASCRTRLPRCLPSVSGHIYLDGCFLRYDNYRFYSEYINPLSDTVNCSSKNGMVVDEREKLDFSNSLRFVIGNVTKTAVSRGRRFGIAEVKGVYALAQCWNTISSNDCGKCLEKAGNEILECAPKRDGRALYAGCFLRYSTEKLDNEDGSEIGGPTPNRGAIIAIILAAAAILMLSVFAIYATFMRLSKIKEDHNNLRQVSFSISKSSLNFKYETLEKATDYFNPKRKIGQGGAGSVFKGTLPNGQVIAVKRLIFNTRQWVDDFFNEVNLITGIQHKNLVQLLGCSIEGPESLLVFEYIPNNSLDHFLFDKNTTQILNWKQRYNIIVGTAEGLAYLHGGTKIRIIHRDIKSSNVLLDENLTAKIADFGLARCFSADRSHLSTGIAGTLGYMAPEYLLRGQLTEKADVYSFGVLVLEIVSGRRTTAFTEEGCSLLQTVWKFHRLNRLEEAVDPSLGDNSPPTEVCSVLQIGLLCTQASAALRPSMDEVVRMLNNRSSDIPLPTQPPFVNARRNDSDNSIKTYSANSLLTSALEKIELSISTTESSNIQSSEGPSRSEDSLEK